VPARNFVRDERSMRESMVLVGPSPTQRITAQENGSARQASNLPSVRTSSNARLVPTSVERAPNLPPPPDPTYPPRTGNARGPRRARRTRSAHRHPLLQRHHGRHLPAAQRRRSVGALRADRSVPRLPRQDLGGGG